MTSISQMDQSSVVSDQVNKALLLYGGPQPALHFLAKDLERIMEGELDFDYKKAPKHLLAIMWKLRDYAEHDELTEAHDVGKYEGRFTWTVPAALGFKTGSIEIPKVSDPVPHGTIEQAWNDCLHWRIQIKQGRWRYHYRGWRDKWITRLCDYDKDTELRARYPLTPQSSCWPEGFERDARAWREDFRKPQELVRREAIERAFGEVDGIVKKFEDYARRLGR